MATRSRPLAVTPEATRKDRKAFLDVFADRLLDEGVWATSVVYPTVALDGARLRTIVTAAHSDEELDTCLAAFGRVGRELGLIAG